MGKTYQYQTSDETFIEAIKTSRSIHQAIKKSGLNGFGAGYIYFKKRCEELSINIDHLKSDRETRDLTTKEQIINACKSNLSRYATLRALQLSENTNTNNIWINYKIKEYEIDISHWTGQGHLRGKTHNWSVKTPLEEILVEKSYYSGSKLKQRLVSAGSLEDKCYSCGITDWQNKKISLHLEHINGNHLDNRLENLTVLCPNCHSQTKTYCRRKPSIQTNENNETPKLKKTYFLPDIKCTCGNKIKMGSKTCKSCVPKTTKIEWPPKEELILMVKDSGYCAVARKLGVSDNAIRKHIQRSKMK